MKSSDFFTRTPSNTGARMVLDDPLTGKPSGETLHVLGLESDAFRAALTAKHRRNLEILAEPEQEQAQLQEEAELDLFASLVTDWSFEEPFSVNGIKELFREAPQVKQAVDRFAGNRSNFIKRLSGN
jgi:hypothetical protein